MSKNNSDHFSGEDFKDQNIKYNLSKHECDLYHEEDDIPNPVIRVKRFSMPNRGEKWKIFQDSKVVYILEGAKLTVKEKEFFHTAAGLNFLIAQYRKGLTSVAALKNEIKLLLPSPEK